MSEEKSNVTSDSQGNNDTSTTSKSQEVWGNREGRKYFRFSTDKIKDIEGLPVHPYLYKKESESEQEGKKVITLCMNGQDEKRKFYEEDLFVHFPGSGKKQYAIYCTEEEADFVKNFLTEILRDEKCIKIFRENSISEIKELIISLA